MEYENRYASKGVGGAGLGLGIAGTALGLMNGGLNGLLNGGYNGYGGYGANGYVGYNTGGCCSEDHYTNRYEAQQAARIAELETEVKLRDANTYTDQKILGLYQYVDGKLAGVESQICQQNVYNATNTATINCMAAQIAQLQGLTKLVIPNTSVCPGWGDVTVTPVTTTTTTTTA